jgi:hypothetical protein
VSEETNNLELTERVKLIESMIAEGRRSTGRWGWTFVLWGVAYYVAAAWATWGRSAWAWPVTMVAAGAISSWVASRMRRGQPVTTLGRAVGGAWIAMGISIMTVLIALGVSGQQDAHVYIPIIGAMLGTAHMTSAIILRWKMQFACALVWLAAGVVACFGSEAQASVAFLVATFLGMIVFGIYAMVLESRRSAQQGVAHA